MARQITDYFLYRWRYVLGYAGIGLVFAALLFMAGFFIPGGVTKAEMDAVVTSSQLALSFSAFDPQSVVNLPYHLLQRISIDLFGVTNSSIKLPSLLLGALSTIGMLVLLRMWFQRNVAVITTALVLTTGQFLFATQSGTPGIVYIFWSVWLLVSATMISRRVRWSVFWKILLFAIAALSLYTPLSIYILVALIGAVALHPHLRYLARKLSKAKLAIGAVCALILLAPLGYAIVKQPAIGWTLLGIPADNPDLKANALQIFRQYFDFISPSSGALMTPVYSLGAIALILLGIFRLFTTKYTARSYLISAWIILLTPVLLVNPDFISVTFVPILLLMAMGVSALINNWYQLFPRNPYARIAGLLPLAVLIGGMVFSGVDRYMYGYLYDPNTASNFTHDISIANAALADKNRGKTAIVTNAEDKAFYTALAKRQKEVSVDTAAKAATTTIYTRSAYKQNKPSGTPYRILTSGAANDADRFYLYKMAVK
ncbi:glycosyltransferase family 39 protein [Streptomyces caniscabiei]|uniref:glycosyltransferase family 39 protein n=1 Tax=Streptomyces caniscabiei TaxID=2746961 RepID=UPI0029ABF895|nr:glycosyltransferase family 39 protein [Streptomyces caniscabiei]MDX2776020.1 glycosyltransferase family 39 protein [Streptomyces caniscabiei]